MVGCASFCSLSFAFGQSKIENQTSKMAKRLCYICEATQGGVRKHLRDLLRVFSKLEEGFEVHAILGDRGEPGFREELDQLRASGANFQYTFVPTLKRAIRPLRDWRAYATIKDCLRAIKPDIVHTHSSKAGILGRHAAHQLGIRGVIHTPHVFPFQWAGGAAGCVYLALECQAACFCRAIVCVGEGQRADALARGVSAADKLVVIRNGIELRGSESRPERARDWHGRASGAAKRRRRVRAGGGSGSQAAPGRRLLRRGRRAADAAGARAHGGTERDA
jgi:glycosyltransferase involved in cell wall biosynthesis